MNNKLSDSGSAEDLRVLSLEMIAATVTHEIKNPLALIKANIDYIELCDTESKYRKNYALMKREIDRANELLCSFGNYLTGNLNMDDSVSLGQLLEEIISQYSGYHTLQIHLDIDRQVQIHGNHDLLAMAFSNVVKNAVEAVGAEGTINISVKRDAEYVVVTVTDDGHGLDADIINKLNNNTPVTTKKNGGGLGIWLIKKILEIHSGIYMIKNRDCGGACVEIRLRAPV